MYIYESTQIADKHCQTSYHLETSGISQKQPGEQQYRSNGTQQRGQQHAQRM